MRKQYKLKRNANGWTIVAHMGAGAATDAAWLSLGGCPSHMTILRVYLALKLRGGR